MCRAPASNITSLAGLVGVAPRVDLSLHGNFGMYTSGMCATGFSTFMSAPRGVYFLSLGPTAAIGGRLTVSTCGHTDDDTVLYVGLGCPTWFSTFQCVVGNDNGDDVGLPCASNAGASTVSITTTSRVYFVQVGGYTGSRVTTGLSWSYSPPQPTPSSTRSPIVLPSRTGSPTRTKTRSRTRTATGTRTRSRTATRTRTRSRTRKSKL